MQADWLQTGQCTDRLVADGSVSRSVLLVQLVLVVEGFLVEEKYQ